MTRKRGQIDFNLLSKAVDEISQEKLTDLVLFHVMGEPTLYPDLEKAVRYTKSKGLRVHLTTNGSLLNERLLNTLLGSDIDHILFSVQTPDERSFSLRHAKIDFHEYKRQIVSCVTKLLEQNVNTVATLSFLTSPFKWLTLPSKRFSTIDNKKSLVTHINCWMKDILIGIEKRDFEWV
jgi:wyosine [tRNA(Phe)-imidazoG37] synthetase (radical SAM superfamily)